MPVVYIDHTLVSIHNKLQCEAVCREEQITLERFAKYVGKPQRMPFIYIHTITRTIKHAAFEIRFFRTKPKTKVIRRD